MRDTVGPSRSIAAETEGLPLGGDTAADVPEVQSSMQHPILTAHEGGQEFEDEKAYALLAEACDAALRTLDVTPACAGALRRLAVASRQAGRLQLPARRQGLRQRAG